MTRRALALFALMSVVWGVPYLLIKVAVEHLTPAVIVEARTLMGGLLLLPLAWREGRIRELATVWRPLALYCVCELAVPWFLLSDAERRLPSSLSGLLVATVPLVSAVLAYLSGHHSIIDRRAFGGLVLGLGGVAVLLGLDVRGAALGSVGMVLVVAVGYAIGPFLVSRSMSGQSSLALASVSLIIVAIGYLPVALVQAPHRLPAGRVLASLVGLGVICTAVAFVAFFELIKETTPTQATIITYFNPVVAVALGVAVLGEPLKLATAVGFVLILFGSWFATGRNRRSETMLQAVRSGGPETAD